MSPEAYPGEAAAIARKYWERGRRWAEQATFSHLPTGAAMEPNDALRRLAARYASSFLWETQGTLPQGFHEAEEFQLVYEFPFVNPLMTDSESGAPPIEQA